uniref:Ribosomal protein L32 n=1 Tax=Byrsonima crassifolia TaxID=4270 RepID=A0A2L1IPD2_BYRCR|nr:ribosomal protein L32 [Byrsonima crassifolia]AVD96614.1 ribosomal protein L32 [Byrsonima crassifolia]
MAVPKKRISISNISKKRIRKNLWKGRKGDIRRR